MVCLRCHFQRDFRTYLLCELLFDLIFKFVQHFQVYEGASWRAAAHRGATCLANGVDPSGLWSVGNYRAGFNPSYYSQVAAGQQLSDSLLQVYCQEAVGQQLSDSLQQVYCQEAAGQQLSDSLQQVYCQEAAGQQLSDSP